MAVSNNNGEINAIVLIYIPFRLYFLFAFTAMIGRLMMIIIGMIYSTVHPDPKVEAAPGTANHRLKHGRLEDGYNKVCTVLLFLLLLIFESIQTSFFLPSFLPCTVL
jgi:hypothetical protein